MNRIFVIADDLTGAAEIGGIAVSHGLFARILLGPFQEAGDADVVILDTNTRHLAPADAASALAAIAGQVSWARFSHVYKKVDSALRGPVIAEVVALLGTGRWARSVLLPQNPSRGRTVLDGRYLIDGVPLHETFMAFDPEHPADTADVLARVGRHGDVPVTLVPPDGALPSRGVALCEAADLTTVRRRAGQVDAATLPVGGADLFRAVLALHAPRLAGPLAGRSPLQEGDRPASPPAKRTSDLTLVVCGSASAQSRAEASQRVAGGEVVVDFPLDLCDGDRDGWAADVAGRVRAAGTVWIAVRCAVTEGWAARIRAAMADAVVRVWDREPRIGRLLIEGGATGAAIAGRAGWTGLRVEREWAGGVVAARPEGPVGTPWRSATVVLKPGSYAWPTDALPSPGRGS